MKRPRTVRDVARRGSNPSVASESSQPGPDVTSALSPAERINRKWAWHHRVLLSLRERLWQERRDRLTEAAQPLEPHSMDPADSASDEFDHNVALAMLSAEQDALREIDAALQRIWIGTYGVCEETGKPIPAARLKAIPWTRFACAAEAQHEAAGEIKSPRLGVLRSAHDSRTADLESSDDEIPAADEVLTPALFAPPAHPLSSDELKPET